MFTRYWQHTSRKPRSRVCTIMRSLGRHLNLFFLCVCGVVVLCFSAQSQGIQHEISSGFRLTHYEYTQDEYVVNEEPFPTVIGEFEETFQEGAAAYTFFFQPLDAPRSESIALQRFYKHPTTLRLHFAVQPETETTYTFKNPAQAYRAQTLTDDRAREASLDLEYYVRENTGVILVLNSVKNEQTTHFSNTLNLRGRGEFNEIRRSYGIGLTQYWREHVRFKVLYSTFDAELAGVETTWTTENSLLTTEAGRERETHGSSVQISGEYIWHKRVGIQGWYRYAASDSHAVLLSSFYENFPGTSSYYDEDITTSTVGLLGSVYIDARTTFRLSSSLSSHTVGQRYQADQVVAYDWDTLTVNTSIEYVLNHHIGLQLGYEFSTREAEIEIGHPQSERATSTTSHIASATHTAFVSILARF